MLVNKIRRHRFPIFRPPKLQRKELLLLMEIRGLILTLMLYPWFDSKDLLADSRLNSDKIYLTALVVYWL